MTEGFCARTARRIQKIGYAPKDAARLSKTCYLFMLFLRGLMGPLMVPSVENLLECGQGKFSMSTRASLHLLSFTIQRRSPAL
jgi:hypothetical protein